jgi:hypothetical protein
MKPSWKDAPSWAQWLAMDQGGSWYWYEVEPKLDPCEPNTMWVIGKDRTKTQHAAWFDEGWETSKEPRPTNGDEK